MNRNFQVIGLTRVGIESESTALEADALTTRPLKQCEMLGNSRSETAFNAMFAVSCLSMQSDRYCCL